MLQKYIDKVKFYPSADNFTQALLVTNITSAFTLFLIFATTLKFLAFNPLL